MERDEYCQYHTAKYPGLENKLSKSLNVSRNNSLPVPGAVLRTKEPFLRTKHGKDEIELYATRRAMHCYLKRKTAKVQLVCEEKEGLLTTFLANMNC